MADENNNANVPSQAVTTIIRSLPKSGEPKRKSGKRGRPRKTASPTTPSRSIPPMPQEEPRSRIWLTTLANLALLIAIFTIIFAAHRAIQNNKKAAPVEIAVQTTADERKEEKIASEEKAAPEEKTTAQKEDAAAPEEGQTIAVEESKKEDETAAKAARPKVSKKKGVKNKYQSDPYTDGGPLDLDRRSLADIAKEDAVISDHRNPWNSGGRLDLDNQDKRIEYKKGNYISSAGSQE